MTSCKMGVASAALAIGLVIHAPASAELLNFSFVSTNAADNFSFQLDSNPVPVDHNDIFMRFTVDGIGPFGAQTLDIAFAYYGASFSIIRAFPAPAETNVLFADLRFLQADPIYSGTTAAPIFAPGRFPAFSMDVNFGDGVLRITRAVPEPASWALMIGGFALAGAALRRRSMTIGFA